MMEKKKNSIDMTHGALWNKILIFALPLAASSILQQLFNSVDTAVVGNFASSQALAAVGSNSSLIALMINLFIGISLGSNVIISRYIGQGVHKNIKASIHTAIVPSDLLPWYAIHSVIRLLFLDSPEYWRQQTAALRTDCSRCYQYRAESYSGHCLPPWRIRCCYRYRGFEYCKLRNPDLHPAA